LYFCISYLTIFSYLTVQYEMERGKLEMELQEERKSRNQWIREQQMKFENSTTKSFSDCGTNDSQVNLVYLNDHYICMLN